MGPRERERERGRGRGRERERERLFKKVGWVLDWGYGMMVRIKVRGEGDICRTS
jgi:hypothetical protein